MSNQNDMFRELQGLKQNRKVISADYTIKVGTASDGFIIDNPVIMVDPAADSAPTITLPNGYVEGQRVLVTLQSDTYDETSTVYTTTGDDFELTAAGDYCCLEWVNSTLGWIALSEITS